MAVSWWADTLIGEVRPGHREGIYPWNFLSRVHIERPIPGTTRGGGSRKSGLAGGLEQIRGGTWCGELAVQEALRNTGVVFDWKQLASKAE